MSRKLVFLLFLVISCCSPSPKNHGEITFGSEVTWDSLGLMFDGKRVVPAMGEIHFSRVPLRFDAMERDYLPVH